MKKTTLAIALLCGTALTASAIPARRGAIQRTLPDGTTIEFYLHGDETFHYATLPDGTLIKEEPDGFFYYAKASEEGIRALAYKVGETMPAKAKSSVMRQAEASSALQSLRQAAMKRRQTAPPRRASSVPGNDEHGLVILVDFPDVKMKYDKQVYIDMLNKEGYNDLKHTGSALDYFKDSSYGKFQPTFEVFGPYTASQESTYYGKNDSGGDDLYAAELMVEACKLAVADGNDLSRFDYDGDGNIDGLYVFYAGEGEATGGSASTIWPHRWVVASYNYDGDPDVGGVKVYDYACSNEIYPRLERYIGNDFDGVGTFIHEFGHVLGLPDLYDTSYYGGSQDPDIYDVMASSNYLNYGRTPVSYSAYERMFMDWMKPVQIHPSLEGDKMTLPIIEEGAAYLLTEKGAEHNMDGQNPSPATFYLIENRSGQGWDYYASYSSSSSMTTYAQHGDCGLLITKIQYNAGRWEDNQVNSYPFQGVSYVCTSAQNNYSGYYPMFPGKKNQTKVSFSSFTIADIERDEATGDVSFTISDLNGDSSGVRSLEDKTEATVTGDRGRILIAGGFTSATVYTPQGVMAYSGNDDTIELPQGIYIVRVDGRATKVIVK